MPFNEKVRVDQLDREHLIILVNLPPSIESYSKSVCFPFPFISNFHILHHFIILFFHLIYLSFSVCVSAVILSSETLNEEPTASASQENVLQKPNIASESDIISEHTTESPTKTDKENKKYLKDLTKSVKSRDDSETERHVVKSETETQLPQPNTLDTQSTGERKEEQLPKDTNSEQNV